MSMSSSSSSSNILQINIVEPSFTVTKTSNKSNVKVGDSFFYNIQILNNGEYPASSVVLTDTLPSEFMVVSIVSNGTTIPGDLSLGVELGPLGPGDSINVIIQVKVLTDIYDPKGFVNSSLTTITTQLDPLDPPTIINIETLSTSSIKVFDPDLEILKTPNLIDVAVGDTVTYTLLVTNTGNVELTNVIVRDNLNPCLKIVDRSLSIDGKTLANQSIISGVKFKNMLPGESHVIKFDTMIICDESQTISNTSMGQFTYTLNCGMYSGVGFTTSNTTTLNAIYSHVNITKEVLNITDCKIKQGSTITYSIELLNDGDVDITNFVLKDKLPSGLFLINDSFVINGVTYSIRKGDLLNGISLGPIPMNESTTVEFSAIIAINSCCNFCNSSIKNVARGNYYFELPDGTTRYRITDVATNELMLCNSR